jgi:glycosyltransferase involved in cell wall biosynthesis
MKIFLIGQKGIPAKNGGVEKHVENLAVRLANYNHEVFVYARNNYQTEKISKYRGVNIITLPSIGTKNLDAISHTFFACLDLILFRKPDVVHFHSVGPSSLLLFIKIFRPNLKIVFTYHCQDYRHQKWGKIARWYLKFGEMIGCRFSDKTITISKELQKYAKEVYQIDTAYIPNGAEQVTESGSNQLAAFDLEKEEYLVSISRLVRHKGIHYLIEAYQGLTTNKKLVIVGDGAFTDEYVAEIKKLAGTNKNIIFTGNQSGQVLSQLYVNAYAFVQPSEYEGLSVALLEAMSFGLPCVVSDIEANLEATGENALVFKNKNSEDLKNKLNELLTKPELAKTLGQKLQERASTEYNWDTIAQNTEILYNQLITKK